MNNPYQVVKDFEQALSRYTGAPYVVCVNSCTAAILLACGWALPVKTAEIPKHTYVSVPMTLKQLGYKIRFTDEAWQGCYQIKPSRVWDCARRFTSDMYVSDQYQCVSFAANKIMGIEQGGAILHDDSDADKWFRRMRFDGRTEGVDPLDDTFDLVGYHCPMLPSIAAQGILRLYHMPKHNPDMQDHNYPDLSQHPAFR